MKFFFFVLTVFLLSSCGVQHHFFTQQQYQNDSSYVYSLPYPKGTNHFIIQGYNSLFSHKGRLAIDFKMKKGSPVAAARGGVVIRAEQSFTKGGTSKKYLGKANQVIIKHSDGSFASYAHLQHNGVLVKVGDSVKQGHIIARAGSTGYSATPHLHFIVWGSTAKGRTQLPTRFKTGKGIEYLKPGKWYKAS